MRPEPNRRRKLKTLDTKLKPSFRRRAWSMIKRTKTRLLKQPLFVLLLYIIVLYAVMIPVFYGCRPDRFLFGR